MPGRGKPFEQGNGGKKRGTVNKKTKAIRSAIQDFLLNKTQDVEALYKKLEPNEQAKFLIGLMAYAVPKLNADVLTNGNDKPNTVEQVFKIGGQEIKF